jgi:hypothetical protein
MTLDQVIIVARKNLGGDMESSARLCLTDAVNLRDAGDYEYAKKRAVASLAYSVGVFHPDYQRATK